MKDAKTLLELLTKCLPPHGLARHNITLNNVRMEVTLMLDGLYLPFILEDEDFDKPIGQLADELCQMASKKLGR